MSVSADQQSDQTNQLLRSQHDARNTHIERTTAVSHSVKSIVSMVEINPVLTQKHFHSGEQTSSTKQTPATQNNSIRERLDKLGCVHKPTITSTSVHLHMSAF